MTILLKQSTAVILKLGPFVDEADAVTAETGLSIGQGDIQISKNGGALAQTLQKHPRRLGRDFRVQIFRRGGYHGDRRAQFMGQFAAEALQVAGV